MSDGAKQQLKSQVRKLPFRRSTDACGCGLIINLRQNALEPRPCLLTGAGSWANKHGDRLQHPSASAGAVELMSLNNTPVVRDLLSLRNRGIAKGVFCVIRRSSTTPVQDSRRELRQSRAGPSCRTSHALATDRPRAPVHPVFKRVSGPGRVGPCEPQLQVVIGWVRFPRRYCMCANRAMDSLSGLSLGIIIIKISFFLLGRQNTDSKCRGRQGGSNLQH